MKPNFRENKPFIFGAHPVLQILEEMPKVIDKIIIQEGNGATLSKIKELTLRKKIELEEKDKKYLDDIAFNQNHQGVIAYVNSLDNYKSIDTLKNKNFVLILDHIEDPHNFGAILRTADQFGVDGVVIPKNRGVGVTPTVVKVSTGASFFVPIIQESSLIYVLERLKEFGFWIYSTSMDEGESIEKVDFAQKTAIILGNEGKGISLQLEKNADFKINIPSSPNKKGDSLNVSVAAGILVYEAFSKLKKHK